MRYDDGDTWPNEGTVDALDGTPNALDPAQGNLTQPAFFSLGTEVAFYHPVTTSSFDGMLTAPNASAVVPTDGFFACGKGRAIRPADGVNPFEDTEEPQFPWSIGTLGITAGAPGTEEMETHHLNIAIRPSDGFVLVGWWGTDGDFDTHLVYLDPGADTLDCYDEVEFAGSLLCDDGDGGHVVTAYVRDDANPDITVATRGWRIIATETIEGTTDLRSADGGRWGAGLGKGFHSYAEWYSWDGDTAVYLLGCRPDTDADEWSVPGDTFATGTTTWTLGNGTATVTGKGLGSGTTPGAGRIRVADHASLDCGTGPFTAWLHIVPTAVGALDAATPTNYMGKAANDVGQGVSAGWNFFNMRIPGFGLAGLNFVFSDGPNNSLVSGAVPAGWVGNPHLVVLRRVAGVASVFIDNVAFGTSLASAATGSLSNNVALTLLDGGDIGAVVIGLGYGYVGSGLTDTEITVDLPAALGIS